MSDLRGGDGGAESLAEGGGEGLGSAERGGQALVALLDLGGARVQVHHVHHVVHLCARVCIATVSRHAACCMSEPCVWETQLTPSRSTSLAHPHALTLSHTHTPVSYTHLRAHETEADL
eukprot:3697458-Rhodomonas_salina.1